MIKAILTALDTSPASQTACELSIRLAKLTHATLSGIGIIDEPWVSFSEAIPLGGSSFKTEIDKKRIADMKHKVHDLEKAFKKLCEDQKVSCSVLDVVGFPSQQIEYFLTEYDLLIIGKDASFHFTPPHGTGPAVRQLIKDNPRPLIVTGTDLPSSQNKEVLVAFDGGFEASRSLHMALFLELLDNKTVHIVTVGAEEESVRATLETASRFCLNHGIKAHLHPSVTYDKAAPVILGLIKDITPSLLVLGAYGHGEIDRFLWGSCAEELLMATEVPVFFFH